MLQDYIKLEVETKLNELHVHGKLYDNVQRKTKVETREVMLEMMDRGYKVVRILDSDEAMTEKPEAHWVFQLDKPSVKKDDVVEYLDDYKNLGSYLAEEVEGKTPRKTEGRQKKLLKYLKKYLKEKINDKK